MAYRPLDSSGPASPRSTVPLLAVAAVWGALWLAVFPGGLLPLAFALPLAGALWARRRGAVWWFAVLFAGLTVVRASLAPRSGAGESPLWLVATLAAILLGSLAAHAALTRARREPAAPAPVADPLAAAAGHDAGKQAEELALRIALLRQELADFQRREEFLGALLRSACRPAPDDAPLDRVAELALELLGPPVDRLAILLPDGDGRFVAAASAGDAAGAGLPASWPAEGSIAGFAARERRTVAIVDTAQPPEPGISFAPELGIGAVLATPIASAAGVLVAAARAPQAWTDEQIRRLDWLAAHAGLWLGGRGDRARLLEARRGLEDAVHHRDELLGLIGHELRGPLNPAIAAAGALAHDGRLPPDARLEAAVIRRNLHGHARQVDDLVELARLRRGILNFAHRDVAVDALVREIVAAAGADLDAQDERLLLLPAVTADARVFGDPLRLRQAGVNLLLHAIAATPAGGKVRFGARLPAGASSRVALVAESDEISQSGPGPTLGLALAQAVVELHGGRLIAETTGRAGRWVLELPLRPGAEGGAARPRPGRDSSLRILLVEDHADTGQVISRLLHGAGHQVTHARDAAEALARFRQESYDLLISDLGLPDESGLALMGKLRQIRPSLPGICMSGYGQDSDLAACKETGFSEHLPKPVDIQRLHAAIARVAPASVAARN